MGKQPDEIDDSSDIGARSVSDVPPAGAVSGPMNEGETEDVYVEVVSLAPVEDTGSTTASDESAQAGTSDLDEQVAQIEETRAEMSETIDAIQQKLSPETVKEQAAEAVRDAMVSQAEQIVGDANGRAGRAASGVMSTMKQHPAQLATGITTVVATAVVIAVRKRLQHGTQGEERQAPPAPRAQMLTNQLQSARARVSWPGEALAGSGVSWDMLGDIASGLQQVIDENRTALGAALAGIGLTAAGRFIDVRREPRMTPMMRVTKMMKSRWMVPVVLAPVGAGLWAARRLMGKGGETGQDLLLAWLNDAYGMENALIQTLQNHARDAKNYPQMQAKLDQHLAQTRRHADMVKSCIERLGGSTNSVKTTLGAMMGKVQGLSTGPAADEVVKDGLADFAAENFEIASYTALIAAAQQLGDRETVATCQQILREEQEMARWLEENLPTTTRETINRLTASGR